MSPGVAYGTPLGARKGRGRVDRIEAIREIMSQTSPLPPDFDVIEIEGIVHLKRKDIGRPEPIDWNILIENVLYRLRQAESGVGWHKSWNPRRLVRERRRRFLRAVEIVFASTTLTEVNQRETS